jgi:Rhodopirellula transposase DDE domain
LIGNLYRPGTLYTQGVVETLDHDFPSLAQGVIIPHGIYDLKKNHGYINLGTSHDTSEFACDSLRQWWQSQGQADYPHASSLLLLCDGGGSNGARTYLFKAELERFAQETGLEVRVAHYPAYTSKYNPIEHRLFPHLQRACQGVIFTSVEVVKELMEKATTKTGLHVRVHILNKVYTTGRKVAVDFKEQMRVIFDEELPSWNYRVLPEAAYTG